MKAKIVLIRRLDKIELDGFRDMVDAIAFKGLLQEHLPKNVSAYLDVEKEKEVQEEDDK